MLVLSLFSSFSSGWYSVSVSVSISWITDNLLRLRFEADTLFEYVTSFTSSFLTPSSFAFIKLNIDWEKLSIIDTVWDDNLKQGGVVYASETDKAFHAIPEEFDWCFYIQGDEVVHEKTSNCVPIAKLRCINGQQQGCGPV